MSYQFITILGNLTRDAEVRQVGQSQVAKIGVAVSERFKKADGTFGESTEYFDAEVWSLPNLFPYLVKGTQVFIIGKLKTDKWQDQSGLNHSTTKVRVDTIQLCGGKPQASAQPAAAPSAPIAPTAPIAPGAPAYAPPVAPQPQPSAPAYQAPSNPTGDLPY